MAYADSDPDIAFRASNRGLEPAAVSSWWRGSPKFAVGFG
jgi:hypothetical protein